MGTIELDASSILTEARRIEAIAHELEISLNKADHSLNRHGLPPWARQSRVAIDDMRLQVEMLRMNAGALRARYTMALIAAMPGGRLFGERLKQFEQRDPRGLLKTLIEANLSASAGESAKFAMRGAAVEIERWIKTKLGMSDVQFVMARAQMRRLNLQAYRDKYGLTKAQMDRALRPVRVHGRVDAWVNPKGLLGKVGIGPAGTLVDAVLQWNNDSTSTMSAPTRAGRIGINVLLGVVAGGGTVAACAGTSGLGCPLAVGTAFGFGASLGADKANEKLLPSDEQKRARIQREANERLARELRKADQWYIENGKPSKTWLDDRLRGALRAYTSVRGVTVTSYYLPGSDQKVAEKTTAPNGKSTMRYWDDRGREIKPR